ncbi:leucine-rich repeat neuronal protein 4 [Sinocyclocheilus grahami]|uniref:leucine-rich repeat neuronal protein 4 n=1 Tax=Sinocyclocheilus grahami TaxID=75366 RepID=UPI0007ACA821|nr:PREDICTED: leucine-rich repeat neuronal protein 4 [Sinocyclocheilus grahami]
MKICDPPALNSSSVEDISTNATSPLCFPIGDNPYPKCDVDLGKDDIFNSSSGNDTIPMPSIAVTESVLTTTLTTRVFIPKTLESSTTTTPTVQQSPNSLEETKFSTKTPTQSPMIVDEMEHKNQEDGQNATESTNCTFDPCVHLQDTCFNRPNPTCICPGVTSDSQPPNSPTSLAVTAVTYRVLLVTWCAPYSLVTQYLLGVQHEGLTQKNLSFSSAVRQVFISDLEVDSIYHICLQAVNGAGSSGPKCASVRMGLNTEVYLYSLLVVCGVLMLIVASLSFCLYKQCKKAPVENPHLTRLISIPNPAFFNP